MADTIHKGMKLCLDRAEAVTEQQIQTALQLNARYFNGEGLTHFAAILEALAQNYTAHMIEQRSP